MSEMDLILMLADAYDAMKGEAMHCNQCGGYISHGREEHENYCKWLKFKAWALQRVTELKEKKS